MASKPKGAPEAAPQEDALRAPEEWEREFFPVSDLGRLHRDAWKHAAASNLHGWAAHAYHENEPLKLSRSDYEAALEAATRLVPREQGGPTYAPHKAAQSRHAPHADEERATPDGEPVRDGEPESAEPTEDADASEKER